MIQYSSDTDRYSTASAALFMNGTAVSRQTDLLIAHSRVDPCHRRRAVLYFATTVLLCHGEGR